jgi:hypothetical protein
MAAIASKGATPCTTQQLLLPMFLPHEVAAMEQAWARKLAQWQKNHARYIAVSKNPRSNALIDQLSASLLDMPLGPVEEVELSTTFDPYANEIGDEETDSLSDEAARVWSDDAIDQLHEGMVMYSLRLLNARGNGKEKKAILSWIFDPHALAYARSVGQEEPTWEVIKPSEVPFGFELCCRLAGFDPERIREGLVPILKNLDLEELFNEVEHERNTEQRIRATKISNTFHIRYTGSSRKSGDSGTQTGTPRRSEDRPTLRLRDRATA